MLYHNLALFVGAAGRRALRRGDLAAAFILLLAACQPATSSLPANPTPVPFPTMTAGRTVRGALPPGGGGGASDLANPATAAALANRPTATPNYAACPAPGAATLAGIPPAGRGVIDEMLRFLSAGGEISALEAGLRQTWGLLGETGVFRADLDLTGEGAPEVVVAYTAADGAGTLLALGCANGVYRALYQAITGGAPPEILWAGDMNNDQLPEIVFAGQTCVEESSCIYQTQVITWRPDAGRMGNLLTSPIASDDPPELRDIDDDRVTEIVVALKNDGDRNTGPLRTGLNIYDWNGALYVLSIVQYDPPRFKIQVVHEADRAFAERNTDKAIPLYELALDDPKLEPWYNDDVTVLQSYIMYRLLMMYAYTDDQRQLDLYGRIVQAFPDPAARPIYAALSDTFWNAFQVTNNLHTACQEVLEVVAQQPAALDLINRYGSRSPTYTAGDLCPF